MERMGFENHEGAVARFSQNGNNTEAYAREARGSSMETRRGGKNKKIIWKMKAQAIGLPA